MKVAVTGSSGLVGAALVDALRGGGHDVRRLVRRPTEASDEVRWDPPGRSVDLDGLAGVEAVVHLAGAGAGDKRWTPSYKAEIRQSRIDATATIADACARLDPPPRVLLSGSAVGYYGDTGDRVVDETGPAGTGFLADVVREWEPQTAPAAAAGVRVVHMRSGIILAEHGGTLGGPVPVPGVPLSLLRVFKLGLGGRIGSGRQWVSWISITDEVRAIEFLLAGADLQGPVNLTSPQPVRSKDWVAAIGRAVHRPAVIPVPAFALRAAIGQFADEAVLISQRVVPHRLQQAGFRFEHPDIDKALAAELG